MAPQLRRRPASIDTRNEAVEDPQDLGEPVNLDDYPINSINSPNSPNSPNFDPNLPSYPVIAPPPRTALSERFIARPRLPSPSPNPVYPPPLPLHNTPVFNTPVFKHPRAIENYLDSSPSENEDEAYEADAQNPCQPLPSLSPSPSISRSPPHIVDRSSFVDNQPEKEQHDELSWQQVRKLPFKEQDDWHKRRIQQREKEYQDVMDEPIKTQRDHPHLSPEELRKAATERKNLLNRKQMQVTRAEASYRDLLARHDQGQHHSRDSPGDALTPSFPPSSPTTSSQSRFFPRGRQLGSNHHSPSSSPSSEDSEAGSSSEEEEGDADDGSETSPRSKHSTRPPASSGSRNPGKSRQAHEAIIQELDRQMERLKADRKQEVEKRRKERYERTKNDALKKYNNARQLIYQRKKRAEDAYEREFPDYSKRRTTPKEVQKHKYIPKVGRGAAERARRGRTK